MWKCSEDLEITFYVVYVNILYVYFYTVVDMWPITLRKFCYKDCFYHVEVN